MINIQYPDYKKLKENHSSLLPTYTSLLETFHRDIQKLITNSIETRVTVKSRVKTFDSYYQKLLKRLILEKNSGEKLPIHDVVALRIVCPFLEDLTHVEDILQSHFKTVEIERKGSQHNFREFGYNATHLIIEMPQNLIDLYPLSELTTIEIQICTILQDAWSEVEHELIYKKKITPLDEPFRRKLAALNANLTLSDIIFQEIRDYQQRLHFELEKRRSSFRGQLETQQPGLIPPLENSSDEDNHGDIEIFSNMDDLLLKALHAHNRKDYLTAINIYSLLLKQEFDPTLRSMVLIHRGMAYFAKVEYDKAVEDFRLATECQPTSSRSFYHLGIAHRVLDNSAEALKALKKCTELNPYYFEGLFGLAKTYFEIEDFAAALEYLEKALRIQPDSTAVKNFRSLVLSRMAL